LIKRDVGETIETAGVTATGGLYSVVYPGKTIGAQSQDILRATFDFSAGRFLSPPAPAVTTFMGTNRGPNWSPDGKYFAYISRDFTIGIRSAESGDTREVSLSRDIVYLLGFTWASDGASFILNGTDAKGRGGIFRVDAQTLRTTLIVHPESNVRNDVFPIGESPDGKYLYYGFLAAKTDSVSVIKRDLVTGTDLELIRRPNRDAFRGHLRDLVLSPNRHFITMSYQYDATTRTNAVLVVRTDGGEPRELLRDRDVRVAMWAPDGQSLFVRKGQELWRAPLDGGQPTKLDVTLDPTWAGLVVHPDGREVAIQTSIPARPAELWVLENFLPGSSVKAGPVATTTPAAK
jgi:Tol biopolymer transport system component